MTAGNQDNRRIQFYLAPLEGITGYIFRNAVHTYFGGFDKYFIPFIKPNQKGHFSVREKQELLREHNEGMRAIPQILTNSCEDFLRTARKLEQYGYEEVNLNLGCPSRTVVTKGRGAGFLAYPDRLDAFLEQIFDRCPIRISIKTRLGMEKPEEFRRLLEIYDRYPAEELIIHPRVQADFYKNSVYLEAFREAYFSGRNKICYNGDIFTPEDYKNLVKEFPGLDCVMIGRGALQNPGLARKIQTGKSMRKEELKRFHDQIYCGYQEILCGEKTVLFKMKELWTYLAPIFTDYKKYAKKIKKATRLQAYEEGVEALFAEQEIEETAKWKR